MLQQRQLWLSWAELDAGLGAQLLPLVQGHSWRPVSMHGERAHVSCTSCMRHETRATEACSSWCDNLMHAICRAQGKLRVHYVDSCRHVCARRFSRLVSLDSSMRSERASCAQPKAVIRLAATSSAPAWMGPSPGQPAEVGKAISCADSLGC